MPTKDPRVDAYIAEAEEFARPVLKHLRKLIHQGCPDAVETIKWSCPFFDYHGLLCGLATFKGFAPSHRTAYLDWISDAKQPATRAKRLATTLSWLAEGKPQNWKYREQRAKK